MHHSPTATTVSLLRLMPTSLLAVISKNTIERTNQATFQPITTMSRNYLSRQERRGIIWLALIVLTIIAIASIRSCNKDKDIPMQPMLHTVVYSDSTINDSSTTKKKTSKKRRKSGKKSSQKRVPKIYPTRDPLTDTIPR